MICTNKNNKIYLESVTKCFTQKTEKHIVSSVYYLSLSTKHDLHHI